MNIITGEKLQNIANIFIGNDEDFNYNPYISKIKEKHILLNNINNKFNNPQIIFSYSHNIKVLSEKIDFFENNFILITHNSDQNIIETEITSKILNCNKLVRWFTQNLCFEHYKLNFLPIGLANSQWLHGNLDFFKNINNIRNLEYKFYKVYMNFSINTNYNKRIDCYNKLKDKIQFLDDQKYYDYLTTLSKYQFCICPEGNGVDTHRFWEALYLNVVPIVISNSLVNIIKKKTNLPILIINDWNDINIDNLKYEDYVFDKNNQKYLSFDYYKNTIENII
jgi:hypothetical protein